ncbi:hypothetical protein EPN87_03400 [archaeon]|nr:MAG: hypothetical protein EPN87_03400 [archaeon]
MRVIYEGRLKHAQKMLQCLRWGRNDFNAFAEYASKNLTIEHTRFIGDARLPYNIRNVRRKYANGRFDYLYPMMYLFTPTNIPSGDINIFIENLYKKATPRNIRAVVNTFVKYSTESQLKISDIKKKDLDKERRTVLGSRKVHTIRFPEENAEFQISPFFNLHTYGFEISRKSGLYDKEKRYPIVEYEIWRGNNGVVVPKIRVTDKDKKGEGYVFAGSISDIVPSAITLFYDQDKDKGWQVIREGHDWNEANPIILTDS